MCPSLLPGNPHLVLLDPEYYHAELKPLMVCMRLRTRLLSCPAATRLSKGPSNTNTRLQAQWALVWLKTQFVGTVHVHASDAVLLQ